MSRSTENAPALAPLSEQLAQSPERDIQSLPFCWPVQFMKNPKPDMHHQNRAHHQAVMPSSASRDIGVNKVPCHYAKISFWQIAVPYRMSIFFAERLGGPRVQSDLSCQAMYQVPCK
jgi:hypothetical protein